MRHAGLGSIVAALLVPVAVAYAAPPAPVLKGTLKGYVENEKRQPVVGAEVSVEIPGRAPAKGTTDAKGVYLMTGVPIGDVKVTIRAKGCFPQDHHVVVAGKGVTNLDATMKLGIRYAGKVVDARGAPVAGVQVRTGVDRGDTLEWSTSKDAPGRATSGADGTFVVEALEPGKKYVLRFRHPRHRRKDVEGLPSKGGTEKADLVVEMEDAAWVAGVVVDEAGKPVAKAKITGDAEVGGKHDVTIDYDDDGDSIFSFGSRFGGGDGTVTDAKGTFTLGGFHEATSKLHVHADGFFPLEVPLDGLEVGKERAGVEAKLERATAALEGLVVDAFNKPLDEAWVHVTGDGGSKSGSTDKAGRFKFTGIPARGTIKVEIQSWDYLDFEQADVAPGTKNLRLVIQKAPRLRVRVVDETDAPIPLVAIRVRPAGAPGDDADAKRRRRHKDSNETQDGDGFDVSVPFLGKVEAVFVAEGYETARAGPWTAKAGATIWADKVTMRKKPER